MIPYVRDIDVQYGRCDQVSPLIRRVTADNPGPFTFKGTGTYIVGAREVAVIDPGPDDPAHLAALRRAIERERVAAVLVTHHHLDHSPLARPLAEATGATIFGRPAPPRRDESGVRTEEGRDDFLPDVVVADGRRFEGPGWTLQALATPGHTSNHICYALAEENALFSGDHIMGWSTTVVTPPDGDMDAYMASLEKVAARRFATLWPTHGPPVTEPAPFLAAYAEHRRERERQILAELGRGKRRIADIVPRLYASVDKRLWPAAARSVWAHMIALVRNGRVLADGEPTLESDYRLA
ncbi:MAG TPA: MBL fold metallo-hydrolase [Caulobacteraceae bacterium]|nr:MBL fold metallo-hydrolase [Caulobacteraceae bacterium]